MSQPILNIGDEVFRVWAGQTEKKVPCFACNTQRFITIIDGWGETSTPECTHCNNGIGTRATGYNTEYEYRAQITPEEVREISKDSYSGKIEYNHSDKMFLTREEAEEHGKILVAEEEAYQEVRRKWKKDDLRKSWSWHVGYHRKNIKTHEQQLKYHTEKLAISKEKAKTPEENPIK